MFSKDNILVFKTTKIITMMSVVFALANFL